MHYLFVLIPLALFASAAALALPWFIVRAGMREIVQLSCACAAVLGLCAATGIFSYADNGPLALLYGCAALACFLYAIDCALPLYMTRKQPRKQQ